MLPADPPSRREPAPAAAWRARARRRGAGGPRRRGVAGLARWIAGPHAARARSWHRGAVFRAALRAPSSRHPGGRAGAAAASSWAAWSKHPRAYAMAEIERFPAVSRFLFIECAGNGLNAGDRAGEPWPDRHRGVDRRAALGAAARCGRRAGRRLGERGGRRWGDAGPALAKAWRDALLAYGQNGAPLRRAQGFPLRLIVPGCRATRPSIGCAASRSPSGRAAPPTTS